MNGMSRHGAYWLEAGNGSMTGLPGTGGGAATYLPESGGGAGIKLASVRWRHNGILACLLQA